jgi:hypothetical protein
MITLSWLTVPFGLALIALSLLDVFLTVLHIQVESPISNKLNRWLWHLLLSLTKGLPDDLRDEILGWGAPMMIGGIIFFWVLLFVVGFALVYLPSIHNPAMFSLTDLPPSWPLADALYFSAVSFFTIGYGDIVPLHPAARFLGTAEGALGLLTISFSVTYLLSVYPLISRKTTLALALNQETGGRTDGVVLAERYVKSGRFDLLGERLRTLNDDLLYMGQAHGLFPVLYYVRPRAVHGSFVRVLVIVQGVIATLRYALDPDQHAEVVGDPRLLILEEGLLSTLHTLAESSHLAPEGRAEQDWPLAERSFGELLDELTARGLATVSAHDRAAAEAHAHFRTATDHYIRAYARRGGYDPEAARATYDRWARDSALVGQIEAKSNGQGAQKRR